MIIIFDQIKLKPHISKHLLKSDITIITIKRAIGICIKKWLRDKGRQIKMLFIFSLKVNIYLPKRVNIFSLK